MLLESNLAKANAMSGKRSIAVVPWELDAGLRRDVGRKLTKLRQMLERREEKPKSKAKPSHRKMSGKK
jgi:hypothetical protein